MFLVAKLLKLAHTRTGSSSAEVAWPEGYHRRPRPTALEQQTTSRLTPRACCCGTRKSSFAARSCNQKLVPMMRPPFPIKSLNVLNAIHVRNDPPRKGDTPLVYYYNQRRRHTRATSRRLKTETTKASTRPGQNESAAKAQPAHGAPQLFRSQAHLSKLANHGSPILLSAWVHESIPAPPRARSNAVTCHNHPLEGRRLNFWPMPHTAGRLSFWISHFEASRVQCVSACQRLPTLTPSRTRPWGVRVRIFTWSRRHVPCRAC